MLEKEQNVSEEEAHTNNPLRDAEERLINKSYVA